MLAAGLAVLGLVAGAFVFVFRPFSAPGGAIPQGWGRELVPAFVGSPAVPRAVAGARVPRHPFMASRDASHMHVDAYASDAHMSPGPLGLDPEVRSVVRGRVGGECATVTFDRAGRIVTVCTTFRGPRLTVLDPRTLAEIAGLDLPQRPSMRSLSLRAIVTDTSGGAYFYLDHLDRAVLATSDRRLRVIAEAETDAGLELRLAQTHDLAPALAEAGHAEDTITTALPDWEGRYWFVTRGGLVGTVDPASGATATLALAGKEIQNSFAVAPDGCTSSPAMPSTGWSRGGEADARRWCGGSRTTVGRAASSA